MSSFLRILLSIFKISNFKNQKTQFMLIAKAYDPKLIVIFTVQFVVKCNKVSFWLLIYLDNFRKIIEKSISYLKKAIF